MGNLVDCAELSPLCPQAFASGFDVCPVARNVCCWQMVTFLGSSSADDSNLSLSPQDSTLQAWTSTWTLSIQCLTSSVLYQNWANSYGWLRRHWTCCEMNCNKPQLII